ncbi:hypothetical protein CEQ90_05840 [Lewinellaceae bacterium SD302]|nr:hypothetical protein CEQ90_05840 [Lewinellaceae bacterium SD302]
MTKQMFASVNRIDHLKTIPMNTRSFFHFLTFALLISFSSSLLLACESQETAIDPPAELTLSEEQAVTILTASLEADAQGLDAATAESVDLAESAKSAEAEAAIECGMPFDSSYNFTRNNSLVEAAYDVTIGWTPECNGLGLVQSISYERSLDGSYTTQRMSSNETGSANWTIDNLTGGGTTYLINGNYQRQGNQIITTNRTTRTFDSVIEFTVENLNIDKGDRRITSGQADFTLEGTSGGGNDFLLEGSIVFLGSGQAVITINGNQYTVSF